MEVLAPAGSMTALRSSVINGADAVYLGLKGFSARANAQNFTDEEFIEAVEFCHLNGVKVYVAFNTIFSDRELPEVLQRIEFCDKANADAYIVQDLGLITKIRRTMPHIVLHGSTQMGIHNLGGALAAQSLGLKRVVLSRETLPEDIAKIKEGTSLELEFFVQGAMCVAFSGNCYFSSLVSGNSGNRGKCLQLCRKKYSAKLGGEKIGADGYFLSPKDLSLINDLDRLKKLGIMSLKIEGRMRRPEYVGESVRIVKKAINENLSDADIDSLKKLYNRGDYCRAYIANDKENIIYPKVQGHLGLKVGKVLSISRDTAKISAIASVGDGFKIIRNGQEVGSAAVLSDGTVKANGDVKTNDEVYLTTDTRQLAEIASRQRQIAVNVNVYIQAGEYPLAVMSAGGAEARYLHVKTADAAKSRPIDNDEVSAVFNKTGGTEFALNSFNANILDAPFIPKSELNEFRRCAYAKLKEVILSNYLTENANNVTHTTSELPKFTPFDTKNKHVILMSDNPEFFTAKDFSAADAYIYNPLDYSKVSPAAFKNEKDVILWLPFITRGKDLGIINRILSMPEVKNVVANNLSAISLAHKQNILLGAGLNLINSIVAYPKIQSVEADRIIAPDNYVYAFGYFPMMTFCHCAYGGVTNHPYSCKDKCGEIEISDDKGNFKFRKTHQNYCYSQLLNTKPIFIADLLLKSGHKNVIIDVTGLDRDTALSAIDLTLSGQRPTFDYTRGNFNKKLN